MRKISFLFAMILMAMVSQVSFGQAFEQGTKVVSVGYGFGNLNRALFKTYESMGGYKYSGMGPLFAKFEYGVSDKIGLGLNIAHINANVKYGTGSSQSEIDWKNTSALLRMNIHFSNSDKLDAFWGAGLGYRFGSWKFKNEDSSIDEVMPNIIPLGFETTIGVRYFFIENLGIYAEAGIAKAPIQFGLNAKF
jgi:hypothetical protein